MPPSHSPGEPPVGALHAARGRGGAWRVADGWEEALLGPAGPPLARWHAEGRLDAVKRGRRRTVWRLRLDPAPGSTAERVAFVKVAGGGRGEPWRSLVDARRPFREARAAARVAAAGVAAAAPLLAGRFGWTAPPLRVDGFAAGLPARCGPARVLITRSVEPAVPLPLVLAAADRLVPAVRRALTAAVAHAVAKLHRAGLFPGDLHPGNVLIRGLTEVPGGTFALPPGTLPEPVLIDLTPLAVRRGWPGGRRRAADSLGMLAHGLARATCAGDRLRALAEHRRTLDDGAALGPWREWAAFAERRRRAESVRRHARRDRHWRRGCRGMEVLDEGTRCVASLPDPAAFLTAADGRARPLLPDGRPTRTLRLTAAAARAGWELGHALRRRGVPVAEPLLCRERNGREPDGAGLLVLTAGAPLDPDAEQVRAARRVCAGLRAWGFTLDAPTAADFHVGPDGVVRLADPTRVRRAGRGEGTPNPAFPPAPVPILELRRAA